MNLLVARGNARGCWLICVWCARAACIASTAPCVSAPNPSETAHHALKCPQHEGAIAFTQNSPHNTGMCTNYRPASIDSFRKGFLSDLSETVSQPFKPELYPLEHGPIIRYAHDGNTNDPVPEWTSAQFGLVPNWVKSDQVTKMGRMAYNARSETASAKNMFRGAWSRRRFCLIPANAFYEPNWESGQVVRQRRYLNTKKTK